MTKGSKSNDSYQFIWSSKLAKMIFIPATFQKVGYRFLRNSRRGYGMDQFQFRDLLFVSANLMRDIAGTYIYSLEVDGKVISNKKMVFTNKYKRFSMTLRIV